MTATSIFVLHDHSWPADVLAKHNAVTQLSCRHDLAAVVRAGAEFQYPAEWLADQTTYRRAVQRAEAARSLDPQPIRRRQREVAEPSVAFGPAAST